MFSGKTEELLRRVKRVMLARQEVLLVKPALDTRYGLQQVVSHSGQKLEARPLKKAAELLLLAKGKDVIAVDEAQFFDDELPEVCATLAAQGKRIICSGLDMDYLGQAFHPMPALLAQAEYITKLHAVCMRCGSAATFSFRLADTDEKVLLGEQQEYEARCRACFTEGMKKREAEKLQGKLPFV